MDRHKKRSTRKNRNASGQESGSDHGSDREEETAEFTRTKSRSCIQAPRPSTSNVFKPERQRRHPKSPEQSTSHGSQSAGTKSQKVILDVDKVTLVLKSDDSSWDEFSNEAYNEVCRNKEKIEQMVQDGFFNNDECPFKITKLDLSKLTTQWFAGLKDPRINFLKSQKGFLKELTIHELPYDFDGDNVLKYIFDEMQLDTFCYGKIPLILNGHKQDVKEFEASEIQISSIFEMFRQFPSIEKLKLKLTSSDISSDAIERIINPPTDIFENLKEFEVIDSTSRQGIFGVFLGLYRNIRNLEKLTLNTQDRNINRVLKCLPVMHNLKELHITSPGSIEPSTLDVIKAIAPNCESFNCITSCANDSNSSAGQEAQAGGSSSASAPGGSSIQRQMDVDEPMDTEDGDNGDERGHDEGEDRSVPPALPLRYPLIAPKTGDFAMQSAFRAAELHQARKLRLHPCGYPHNIFLNKNYDELDELLAEEEFYDHITAMFIEDAKIVVEFKDGQDDYPEQFKAKIGTLSYHLNEKVQLKILILINNPQVVAKCQIPADMTADSFILSIPRFNAGISSSRWMPAGEVTNGSIYMQMDAQSYHKIMNRRNKLDIDGTLCDVEVIENPYAIDVAAFNALGI
ncbi:uncharacterized protein [Chironomus tepperi]|uniref:uncharacterized protein n=1 Tax=Chironomus tepperi TaxID=113505 RepID=UPI00391F2BAD